MRVFKPFVCSFLVVVTNIIYALKNLQKFLKNTLSSYIIAIMTKTINEKIGDLSSKDQERFWSELDLVVGDRYTSAKYGLIGKDYAFLPSEKVQEVKEKLYQEMFGSVRRKQAS